MSASIKKNAVLRHELGVLAQQYALSQTQYVGSRVLPVFPALYKSSDYPVIPLEALLKIQNTARAERAGVNRGDWEFTSGSYNCKENAWEEQVGDGELKNYASFFDLEQVATERATDIILRAQEKRVADLVMNTTNACGTLAAHAVWSDKDNATSKEDMTNAIQEMRLTSGLTPNAAVLSSTLMKKIMLSKEIASDLNYTSPPSMMALEAQQQLLATYWGIDQVIVTNTLMDTAREGKAADLAELWSSTKVALVRISNNTRDLKDPCFGRTFLWKDRAPSNIIVEYYREEATMSNVYRARQYTDEAIVYKGGLFLLTGVSA